MRPAFPELPIPSSFSSDFDHLSQEDRRRVRDNYVTSQRDGSDGFDLYVAARVEILERGWLNASAAVVAEQLLQAGDERRTQSALRKLVFWLLVEEHKRWDLLFETIDQAFEFLLMDVMDVVPSVTFDSDTIRRFVNRLDELKTHGTYLIAKRSLSQWGEQNADLALEILVSFGVDCSANAIQLLVGTAKNPRAASEALLHYQGWLREGEKGRKLAYHALPDLVSAGALGEQAALADICDGLADQEGGIEDALFALERLAVDTPSEQTASFVRKLADDPRDVVLKTLLRVLGRSDDAFLDLTQPILERCLSPSFDPSNAMHWLDRILSRLVTDEPSFVEGFLARWLAQHEGDLETIDSQGKFFYTFHQLTLNERESFVSIVTTWLAGSSQLARAAHHLMTGHPLQALRFKTSPDDRVYQRVLNRLLGFALRGEDCLRLVASLLDEAVTPVRLEATYSALEELVVQFPGASKEFLDTWKPTNDAQTRLRDRLQEFYGRYYAPLDRTPLREFTLTSEQYNLVFHQQRRQQDRIKRNIEASGRYLGPQILPTVQVYRCDTLAYTQAGEDILRFQGMAKLEQGVEMPRLDLIQPELMRFRRIQRIEGEDT